MSSLSTCYIHNNILSVIYEFIAHLTVLKVLSSVRHLGTGWPLAWAFFSISMFFIHSSDSLSNLGEAEMVFTHKWQYFIMKSFKLVSRQWQYFLKCIQGKREQCRFFRNLKEKVSGMICDKYVKENLKNTYKICRVVWRSHFMHYGDELLCVKSICAFSQWHHTPVLCLSTYWINQIKR